MSPERVKKYKAVAGSESARSALDEGTLTLDEAAAIAEFEGDDPIVERLLRTAGRPWFDHEVERARGQRRAAAEREAASGPWREKGFTVVVYNDAVANELTPMHMLRTEGGETVDESAVKNPGNWAIALTDEAVFTDQDGNPVDESLIDWATEDDPEAQAEEGMLHCDAVIEKIAGIPGDYYCLDPEEEGLTVC